VDKFKIRLKKNFIGQSKYLYDGPLQELTEYATIQEFQESLGTPERAFCGNLPSHLLVL